MAEGRPLKRYGKADGGAATVLVPMARGERGPEVNMPLERGPDGRLRVVPDADAIADDIRRDGPAGSTGDRSTVH